MSKSLMPSLSRMSSTNCAALLLKQQTARILISILPMCSARRTRNLSYDEFVQAENILPCDITNITNGRRRDPPLSLRGISPLKIYEYLSSNKGEMHVIIIFNRSKCFPHKKRGPNISRSPVCVILRHFPIHADVICLTQSRMLALNNSQLFLVSSNAGIGKLCESSHF